MLPPVRLRASWISLRSQKSTRSDSSWSLWLVVAGVVVLDFAVQAVHVSNQHLLTAAYPDGTSSVYGHINRSLVRKGQEVAAGEVIAEVGNRGRSTGPHLHMEVVTPHGNKINPRPWLDDHGITV